MLYDKWDSLSKASISGVTLRALPVQFGLIVLLLLAAILTSCISEKPKIVAGSCTLSLSPTATDEEAIQGVLSAEGELVVKQEIEPLMALWAEDSSVVDAKHTPQDTSDDQLWQGKDAIRHRYVRVVFPGAPTSITPRDMQVVIDDDQATVQSTTEIDGEESKAGDRWNLVKQSGCWLIDSLTYNLEASGG